MTDQLITFQLDDQVLGVDIMAIREIRAWSPATPLPNVPHYVRGVVNLRGVVLRKQALRRQTPTGPQIWWDIWSASHWASVPCKLLVSAAAVAWCTPLLTGCRCCLARRAEWGPG